MGKLSWEDRKSKTMIKNCLNCYKEFNVFPSEIKYGQGKFCSLSCRSSGKFNTHWNGGRRERERYILIWKPNHPFCHHDGYVFEHRLIMEKKLGRYLTL